MHPPTNTQESAGTKFQKIQYGNWDFVAPQRFVVTCKCCNICAILVVHGTNVLVRQLHVEVTLLHYNGVEKMGVRGMDVPVRKRQKVGICNCYNGVDKMIVHGMNGRVLLQQRMATLRY